MAAALPCFARRSSHAHRLRSKEYGRFGNGSLLFGRSLPSAQRLSRAARPLAVGDPGANLKPVGSTVVQECKSSRRSRACPEGHGRMRVRAVAGGPSSGGPRARSGGLERARWRVLECCAFVEAKHECKPPTEIVPSVGPAEYRSAGLQGGCRHRLRPCRRRCRAWPRSNAKGRAPCEWSNPSIERTHNGGAQCPAPSRVVPPLCAAHVKR